MTRSPSLNRIALLSILAAVLASSGPGRAAAQEVEVGELEVGGGKVRYEVAGDGAPVVLVHGGVMDLRMWDPQFAAFANRHRVVRFDLRGFGSSPPPTGAYAPADDMAALLDHLGIDRAAVVGLSMGGGVALDFALAYPERVTALVLAEPGLTGHQFSSEVMASMQKVGAALMQGDIDGAVEGLLNSPAMTHAKENPAARGPVEMMIRDNIDALMSAQFMQFKAERQVDRLDEIEMPTLVLISEYAGPDALEITEQIATQAPAARKVTIRGSGHLMNLENSRQFNETVLAFLRGD